MILAKWWHTWGEYYGYAIFQTKQEARDSLTELRFDTASEKDEGEGWILDELEYGEWTELP